MTTLDNARFKGMIDGRRIYREKRGIWHVQAANRPNEAVFTGTLREVEKAMKKKLVKMFA